MNKKSKILIACSFLAFAFALVVAVYGFSWRNVLVAGVVLTLWNTGEKLWGLAFRPPPFRRWQFRIALSDLASALKDAGLYDDDELEAAASLSYKEMLGRGFIIFTWMEPELFFINTTNLYSSHLEISIDLPGYRERAPTREFQLADMIELRLASSSYELVLLTREQRYSNSKGLVLFNLPYTFFRSLRFDDPYESHDKLTEILAGEGLTYHSIPEVRSGWDYRNKYGSFRWWDV
jgi:hypothetical protein